MINHILIVAPNWIGDAVMAAPAISLLRCYFPKANISISGLPHIVELFQEDPHIDDILPFNKGGLMETWRTAMGMRDQKYDLTVLFPNSFRSALMTSLAGIPLRCGYIRDIRGFLLNLPVKLSREIRNSHQSEYYMNIITALEGYTSNLSNKDTEVLPKLYLSEGEIKEARKTLEENDISPDSLIIGINAGAAYGSSKRWHPDRYGRVASMLTERYQARIILFGSRNEKEITDEILRHSQASLLNMAGRTSIRQLMALISCCRMFITNDSGPMHMASALNVPIVAIFGSTDPDKSGPAGNDHIIIRKEIACSPCFMRECPADLKCMNMIEVEDVLEAASRILKSLPQRREGHIDT